MEAYALALTRWSVGALYAFEKMLPDDVRLEVYGCRMAIAQPRGQWRSMEAA
ncbi:MAG: hypothetical protein R3E92_08700 [Burkholderiaceae bacterium]